jgi:hypothetical protein
LSYDSTELEQRIRESLGAAGLLQALDEYKSQFLEFPDGFFVELVLKDGSKQLEVERIAREFRESLGKQGVELDVLVRSDWTIQEIEGPKPAVSVSGGLRAAWAYSATLASGNRTTDVEVDVTQLAILEIKRKANEDIAHPVDETVAVKELVKKFLKFELSLGGESYWDPIQSRELELNESALSYLIGQAAVGKS